jgi:hypothetical protein
MDAGTQHRWKFLIGCGAALAAAFAGCGRDGTEADRIGVAAECTSSDDCLFEIQLECLTDFKGGYCGLADCEAHADCPVGSACVAHTDGFNYCFRQCDEKWECNRNRTRENESNCSSNITFVEPLTDTLHGRRACVPPSG